MVGFELVLWASSSWIVLKLILDNELTIQRLRRTIKVHTGVFISLKVLRKEKKILMNLDLLGKIL